MSYFATPKPPLHIAGRQLRRRLITTENAVSSEITAAPPTWDEPRHASPSLFDDTNRFHVPDTQEINSSQPMVPTPPEPVISETQSQSNSITIRDSSFFTSSDSLTFRDSLSFTPSLLPLRETTQTPSLPLVTSSMLPPDDDAEAIHARTVSELILANVKISEMTKEISDLKSQLTVATAVQNIIPPSTVQTGMPPLSEPKRDMLLFRASGRFQVLSNFFPCTLHMFSKRFASAEHAYQYQKAIFHRRNDIALRVLRTQSPYKAKDLMKSLPQTKSWHDQKADFMKTILHEKSKQCPVFRKALVNTGMKKLIHNTETDSFWGCGEDFNGLNTLGCLLEDLRLALLELPMPDRHVTPVRDNPVIPPSVPKAPCTAPSQVLVLGNSNARGVAQSLISRGLNSVGYTLPGGTIPHITSRIKHLKSEKSPECILLMAGDIEAADGLPAENICARLDHLVKETRQVFPWSRVILSGLPRAGNNFRQNSIHKVNNHLEKIASDDRLVEFVDNSRARLRESIHLSNVAREKMCFHVSLIAKKFSL